MSGSFATQGGFHSLRGFFRWASSLAAAISAVPLVSSTKALSSPTVSSEGEDYYAKLGVSPIINAAGTYTTLTAACMPPRGSGGGAEGCASPCAIARFAAEGR